MFQRLVFTLATAVSLTGLYVLYSVAMRPVVAIPIPLTGKIEEDYADVQRPAENVRIATKYIPEKRWPTANQSNYMLKTEGAFVYTDSWSPDKDNGRRVIFTPFAMVWVTKSDKDQSEQAISMVSDSAMLEFASEFDEKNQNTGRIVGAVLSGAVDIAGPDNLSVKGSEFHFEESGLTLYTHNPVQFHYQSNIGVASRMRMKLIPGEGQPAVDRPHIYGVESIHLNGSPDRKVRLQMEMPQGGELRTIKIQCADELKYLVADHKVIFEKDVVAWTDKKSYDSLRCESLTMQFTPKQPEKDDVVDHTIEDAIPVTDQYQKIDRNLEFSWLEAVGVEGIPVKISSPSNGIVARMSRFTYSEDTRTVFMSSENSRSRVEITRSGSILKVSTIQVQLDEQKKNVTSIECLGKGDLKYFDEATGRLTYAATWLKRLLKTTDKETKLDLVELEGGAQLRQPKPNQRDSSGLTAELIKIWLAPMEISLPSSGNNSGKPPKTPEPVPKRMLAQREVRMVSPQMQIDRTDELDLRFEEETDSPSGTLSLNRHRATKGDRRPKRPSTTLRPTELLISNNSRSNRLLKTGDWQFEPQDYQHAAKGNLSSRPVGFASVPLTSEDSLGPPIDIPFDDPIPPTKRKQPARSETRTSVSADRIGVRVRRMSESSEFQPREVHSIGKVVISHERRFGEKPMKLTGDGIDLQIESQERLFAHVQGAPASIRDRGFEIEGKDLNLDRGTNQAWVSGSGLLKLPLPADRKIPGMDPNESRDLIIQWDESMKFDGLEAKFLGRVEAKLGLAKMHCEQMRVELVNRISFQEEKFDTEPELRMIHCHENVKFEYSTYKMKKRIDDYSGRMGDFTLNYVKGTVDAQGPGEIFAWKRQEKTGTFTTREAIQANRPIPTEVAVWDFTKVKFEGRLTGFFNGQSTGHPTRQTVKINDRVEVVYGPVNHPLDKVDPDNLPSMAGSMRCDQLEFTNHPETERSRELVGNGNAEVEGQVDGRRFTASADQISFDESKLLYILRSGGRPNARLTGIGSGNLIYQQVEFNPKTKYFHATGAVEGQGSQ